MQNSSFSNNSVDSNTDDPESTTIRKDSYRRANPRTYSLAEPVQLTVSGNIVAIWINFQKKSVFAF
jgi:hypothetical protein